MEILKTSLPKHRQKRKMPKKEKKKFKIAIAEAFLPKNKKDCHKKGLNLDVS